jgi:hypothetical protein
MNITIDIIHICGCSRWSNASALYKLSLKKLNAASVPPLSAHDLQAT